MQKDLYTTIYWGVTFLYPTPHAKMLLGMQYWSKASQAHFLSTATFVTVPQLSYVCQRLPHE